MSIKPFFMNSNICLKPEDISSFDTFMSSIAGNTGNAYITYSLIKELGVNSDEIRHIKNIYQYNFSQSDADIEYINSECTNVFLILQDQIRIAESYGLRLPYDNIMNFIAKLNKPVVIAGLGANSFNGFDPKFYKQLNPDLVRFLKFLSDHCVNMGVRGEFTADVLSKLGIKNVTVVGCPSFFETGPNRVITKHNNISLDDIVLTQRFCVPELANNHTIMQDFQEEGLIRALLFNDLSLINSEFELKKLFEGKYHIFSDMVEWKKFLSKFSFAIGNRLHGSIAALNSGCVAVCCNKDSRAREMCNFLHIPYNSTVDANTDVMKIYNELDVDDINKNYPRLYKNFAEFIHKSTGIKIHEKESVINQPCLNMSFALGQNVQEKLNNIKLKRKYDKLVRKSLKYKLVRFLSHITFGKMRVHFKSMKKSMLS